MKVINGIIGVLSVIGSIYCIFFPGMTFINSGWIITVILGIFGICSIIFYFTKRKSGNGTKVEGVEGVLGLVVGIAAAVVSILALCMPKIQIILDIIILIIFAIWLIVDGISSIAEAIAIQKSSKSNIWILPLVLGLIVLIMGIYGIYHLVFVAQAIGFMIGIMLMTYGIKQIIAIFEKSN